MIKLVLNIVLLTFVAATVGLMLWRPAAASNDSAANRDPQVAAEDHWHSGELTNGANHDADPAPPHFAAYYFHGQQRCHSCNTIETQARIALEESITKGDLRFHTINVSMPQNDSYIELFELHMPTVGLAEIVDEKIVRHILLNDAWAHLRNPEELRRFVRSSWHNFRDHKEPQP